MSRVINSNSPGQNRNRLLKLLVRTIDEIYQSDLNAQDLNDALAFIVLSLIEIERTIAQTTDPWEKREYWVKADQFRNEWKWITEIKTKLNQSRTDKGWAAVPPEIGILEVKLKSIEPLKRLPDKTFWKGAYSILVIKK